MYINGYVSTKMSAIRRCPLSRGGMFNYMMLIILLLSLKDTVLDKEYSLPEGGRTPPPPPFLHFFPNSCSSRLLAVRA
jgi:hypothetical protein